MNNLIAANQDSLTMSSREIAELVGSRHSDLMRSIDRLSEKKVISKYAPMAYTNESNKQRYFEYLISKRDTYVIVAQNCPEFTALIVDRWQELESKKEGPALPQNYLEALEHLVIKEKQLIEQAPKVAFVDNCVERGVLMTATQVAQKHKLSAVKLNRFLDELGGVYSKTVKRGRAFLHGFIEEGLGEMKQTELGHSQALFTAKGEQWINEQLISEGEV